MSSRQDADGVSMRPPPSRGARSRASRRWRWRARGASSVGLTDVMPYYSYCPSSARALVQESFYRDQNLALNNIYFSHSFDPMPQHVNDLVERVSRDRHSPGPSLQEVEQDRALQNLSRGAAEMDVKNYFRASIFPSPTDVLRCSERLPMTGNAVPNTHPSYRVSNPVPDMLYGYEVSQSFSPQQARFYWEDRDVGGYANSSGLAFPLLAIEFKADGPSGFGSLWVATNQCLGASATCVNIAQRLNRQLERCEHVDPEVVKRVNSAAFAIAMSGSEARLFVSWKQNDSDHCMQPVKSFLLQDARHFLDLRKYVRNIMDWGMDERLREIRDSLDVLRKEKRLRASA